MAEVVDASPSYLSLTVSSSLSEFGSEKRFAASTTIKKLKVMYEALPIRARYLWQATPPVQKGEWVLGQGLLPTRPTFPQL